MNLSGDGFECLELIGRGSFGQIRKVRRIADGRVLVRKEISYKSMNQKEKAQLIAEFRILKSLVHPNIVQYLYHEHVQDEHVVHLYMEYCGGGDLAGLIRQCRESNEYVPESIVWSIFTQLILALYRCHYNSDPPPAGDLFSLDPEIEAPNPSTIILHRDIKPDNVFLDGENCVKLGDFGLAKMLDQEHLLANTYVGTPYYMSPEVLMDQPYTPQSDIWSLGCVIYELCSLHPPFQAKSHLLLSQKIREGVYPAIPECYSSTLNKTISACINTNPHQRPTTATLLKLDVIKLCRKEREISDLHKSLQGVDEELNRREQMLIEREQQLMKEFEEHKESLEHEVWTRLEKELSSAIEKEVDRRVELILKEKAAAVATASASFTPGSPPRAQGSPSSDISMVSPASPTLSSRNVRGPRSIRDNIISPLRAARQPFDDVSNHQFTPSSPLSSYSSSKSTGTSQTSTNSGYTSNWQTAKDIKPSASAAASSSSGSTSPQRAAPYYHIVHGGIGMGAAAAKAKLMGIKGTPGSLGRATVQIQRDSNPEPSVWDEAIHGDDMPSPFLKRWERRIDMNSNR
ncbi:hypothetical protein TRVA0_025S01464 [Trichomonascus vanleenenianus]|uniref:serine/threonine protein kinase KIN3 n=1 Tax=Trichomonascus vanleenenianus TaxID=2268995 RepID=UPI003EC98F0D